MKKLTLIISVATALYSCQADMNAGANAAYPGTGQGGSLARFAVSDHYMYAVNGSSLRVFDIDSEEDPNLVYTTDLSVDVETIFIRDDSTMFIGSTQGMFIYDISNPPNVSRISEYRHVTSCDPVVANHRFAYVTLRSTDEGRACNRGVNQLDILDIRDLHNPHLINSVSMNFPIGLGLYGDTLLVCDEGIKVFNVNNPNNLQLMSSNTMIDAVDLIPFGKQMIFVSETGIAQYLYHQGTLTLLSRI